MLILLFQDDGRPSQEIRYSVSLGFYPVVETRR